MATFANRLVTFSASVEQALSEISQEKAFVLLEKREETPHGVIAFASESFLQLCGAEREAVLGKPLEFLNGKDTDEELWQGILDAIDEQRVVQSELMHYKADGTPFKDRLRVTPASTVQSKVLAFVEFQDLTGAPEDLEAVSGDAGDVKHVLRLFEREQVLQGGALETLQHSLVGELQQVTQSFLISDAQGEDLPLVYVSPSFMEFTGYNANEILGRNCRFLQGPGTDPAAVLNIREALSAGEPVTQKILNYRKNGEPFWNLLHIKPVYDSAKQLRYFVGVQHHLAALGTATATTERQSLVMEPEEVPDEQAVIVGEDDSKIVLDVGSEVDQILRDLTLDIGVVPFAAQGGRRGTDLFRRTRPSIVEHMDGLQRRATVSEGLQTGRIPGLETKMEAEPKEEKPTARISVVKQTTTILERISQKTERTLAMGFFKLGLGIARHPGRTILIALLIVGLCGIGFLKYTTENRTEKLWIPQSTDTLKDKDYYEQFYGGDVRINSFVALAKDGGNMLTKTNLQAVVSIIDSLKAMKTYPEGQSSGTQYTLENLCLRSKPTTPCLVFSVLSFFDNNSTILQEKSLEEILVTINNRTGSNTRGSVLGGLTVVNDKITEAKALKVTILLKNRAVVEAGREVDRPAEGWEKAFITKLTDTQTSATTLVVGYPESARSFSDVFSGAIRSDVALLSSSIMLIVAYCMLNIGRIHRLESGLLLSLGAVGAVGLRFGHVVIFIIVSFGLSSAFDQFYGPVHTVLPFILLGIGVDDAFVLAAAFRRTKHMPKIEDRLSEALSHAGVSITVTSLTDFVAFLMGYFTDLPALSSFCIYAAIGVIALFCLQSTVFSAALVYDARRVQASRMDCCPCFHVKTLTQPGPDKGRRGSDGTALAGSDGFVSRFLRKKYAPALMKTPVRAIVIVVFVGLLGFGIFGATQLKEDASLDPFIPSDSYFAKTKAIDKEYFGIGTTTVFIVTKNIDYFAQQDALAAVPQALVGTKYLKDPLGDTFSSWYSAYLKWLKLPFSGHSTALNAQDRPPTATEFYQWLKEFIDSDFGTAYASDVVFELDTTGAVIGIQTARMSAQFEPLVNSTMQVGALDAIKQQLREKVTVPAFAFAFQFLFWEQYKVIGRELTLNISLSLVAVFVITLILIAHPATSTAVFFCVAFTVVDLLGMMWAWNVSLDSVASVNLVLAIGLSVDYSAHIGHNFMLQLGETRIERVVSTMGDMGGPVINGALSTFCAICLLSLSKSYVFNVFFKMFFLTGALGVAHGIIFLPVVLSILGPHGAINQYGGEFNAEEKLKEARRNTAQSSLEKGRK